ncbi:MAG: hypothetical protein NXI20_27655 [bacterium]|nr:hypothetical protein [bacterium]
MSFKRKGQLTKSPEWWKHLKPELKRYFWKRERLEEKKHIEEQVNHQ